MSKSVKHTCSARLRIGDTASAPKAVAVTFPKPVSLGDPCVGWVDSEVHDWILARVEERDLAEGTAVRATGHLSVAS